MAKKLKLKDLLDAVSWMQKGDTDKNESTNATMVENLSYSLYCEEDFKNLSIPTISPSTKPRKIIEKSAKTRDYHNLLEKQRREAIRKLLKKLQDLLPTPYRHERMSTTKKLSAGRTYVEEINKRENKLSSKLKILQYKRFQLAHEIVSKYINKPPNSINTSQNNSIPEPPPSNLSTIADSSSSNSKQSTTDKMSTLTKSSDSTENYLNYEYTVDMDVKSNNNQVFIASNPSS